MKQTAEETVVTAQLKHDLTGCVQRLLYLVGGVLNFTLICRSTGAQRASGAVQEMRCSSMRSL